MGTARGVAGGELTAQRGLSKFPTAETKETLPTLVNSGGGSHNFLVDNLMVTLHGDGGDQVTHRLSNLESAHAMTKILCGCSQNKEVAFATYLSPVPLLIAIRCICQFVGRDQGCPEPDYFTWSHK